jgi:hypothetical protein
MLAERGYTISAVGWAPYRQALGENKPNLSVVNGYWVAATRFFSGIGSDPKSAHKAWERQRLGLTW